MKKIVALIVLIIFGAFNFCSAQFSKVEIELGEIQYKDVAPLIEELTKSSRFLKSSEVSAALVATSNKALKLNSPSPYRKQIDGAMLYAQLKKSTVVLISNGLRATGIVLADDGVILTNYHVLQMFGDSTRKNNQPLLCMNNDGKFYPVVSILSNSKINDLALIKVDIGKGTFTSLPLGETMPEGTEIFAMGHPAHILHFFSKGIIAKNFIRNPANPKLGEDFRMAITADYSLGESGGPIVDQKGNLVGVISSAQALYGIPSQKINPQMTVKSSIPVIALKQLLH